MKLPVSVCMIVRNEEQNLQKTLPSIMPYVAEVIVVDTGSTDQTAQVAEEWGAHVYTYEWHDDFSAARNYSLAQATQPYIFVIDADESFVPESAEALDHYCSHQGQVAGNVLIHNQTADDDAVITIKLPRLFPNSSAYRYERRIHEQLRYQGQEPPLVETGVTLRHSGYTKEAMQEKNKIARNLQILQAELHEGQPDPYLLYQIGKTYYVDRQYQPAADYYQQAIDVISAMQHVNPSFLPPLLAQYAFSLLQLKQFSGVFQVLSTAIDLYPDFAQLYFLYGQTCIELGDPTRMQDVREAFEYCLRLGESDKYESVHGIGSFLAEYHLGIYYEVTGDLPRAREYYSRAAAAHYKPASERLQQLS